MRVTPIRMKRINAGIEINNAVEKLGISKSMFYKIEQGNRIPGHQIIVKMSLLYGCSIDEIYKALKINKKVS